MSPTVTVLFFASAREAAGGITSTPVNIDLDEDTKKFRQRLADLYPKLANLVLDEENLTLALNEEYVPVGEVMKINDGDTIALIPPISGG